MDYKKLIPDSIYLRIMFKKTMGKKLNLSHPVTFNEKLQWLKLHDRKPEYVTMVDKYLVKDYVAGIIGKQYVIPTIGVWDHVEDIDFTKLPDQFVLKCTHDSGGLVICKDKNIFSIEDAKRKLNASLKTNYYWIGREWPYKNVKPRIIAEQYMEDDSGELKDYKFFCFNGQAKCFKVDFDRFVKHHANYYDLNKNLLRFGETICPPEFEKEITLPKSIDQMALLAEKLATNIPFLRADFYDIAGDIYFGELTFFPSSGFGPFIPDNYDELLGSWVKLPGGVHC